MISLLGDVLFEVGSSSYYLFKVRDSYIKLMIYHDSSSNKFGYQLSQQFW